VRRILVCGLFALFTAQLVSAEVTLTERKTLHQQLAHDAKDKPVHTRPDGSKATGSQALIDSSGLKYFINTNITFSTSNSASGAMSEASYTQAVAATTLNGGTTSSTLDDAFDGYGAICIGQVGDTGPCPEEDRGGRGAKAHVRTPLPTKGKLPDYITYNQNGPATTECDGRQIVLPTQTIPVVGGSIQVSRKVFVPANDSFGRWLNIVTNPGATPVTFNLIVGHNLGSDNNTKIVTSSNGNNTAEITDTWIASFQNFSGTETTSSDVRLGHVLQGPGAINPVTFIHFLDGTVRPDEPYWGYTLTLAPGQTRIIANFVAGQPSNAASAAKAAQLVGLPTNATQCLTPAERLAITNFGPLAQPVPTLGQTGLISLGVLLAGFALLILRRRSATA
jgi:hypothetical protein